MTREEAIEILKDFHDKSALFSVRTALETLHPELNESEDERMRKAIIDFFSEPGRKEYILKGFTVGDVLTWLEKQGEQKPYSQIEKCINCQFNFTGYCNGTCILGEEKVEPKFHEGEWLCENEPNNYARFIQILEIVNVQGKERYRISRDIHNDEDIVEFDFVEKYYHKFDIEDANPGDVLFEDKISSHPSPFIVIFKKKDSVNTFSSYCFIGFDGKFYEGEDEHYSENLHPATKEQRDFLFQKIKEAGYEWDAEKKELIKVPKTKEPEGTLKKLLDEQDKFYKEAKIVLEDKDTALAFLRRTGIIDEYGELAEKYRSVQTPATTISAVNGANSIAITDGNTSVTSKEVEKQYCTGQYEPDVREFPIEWKEENVDELSEFELAMMHIGGSFFGEKAGLDPNSTDDVKEQAKFLLSLVPKQEWSEEDDVAVKDVCDKLNRLSMTYVGNESIVCQEEIKWLKSLKDRYTWKPSDEQIKVCKEVYANFLSAKGCNVGTVNSEINRLEEQLKKLREE